MKTLLNILGSNSRTKGTKAGMLAAAATTGITVARFLGKRSIWGIVGGVGVTLAAEYIQKKYSHKLETKNEPSVEDTSYQEIESKSK